MEDNPPHPQDCSAKLLTSFWSSEKVDDNVLWH